MYELQPSIQSLLSSYIYLSILNGSRNHHLFSVGKIKSIKGMVCQWGPESRMRMLLYITIGILHVYSWYHLLCIPQWFCFVVEDMWITWVIRLAHHVIKLDCLNLQYSKEMVWLLNKYWSTKSESVWLLTKSKPTTGCRIRIHQHFFLDEKWMLSWRICWDGSHPSQYLHLDAESGCDHPFFQQIEPISCHRKTLTNIMRRAINDLVSSWISTWRWLVYLKWFRALYYVFLQDNVQSRKFSPECEYEYGNRW